MIHPANVNHSTLLILPGSFKKYSSLKKLSVDLMSAQMRMVEKKSTFTLIDYLEMLIFSIRSSSSICTSQNLSTVPDGCFLSGAPDWCL